ncbi:hypothetical protein [Streptoalloteichus hindustanus]|uniref:Uncharacterized protein n=1 Tax=Streptoalloteichus hindustanus TaxID=2017 RepID=A0A1M5J446_STRHI|nr:hypothetical protein [Streptoalloteichus hindustanus]SHG35377.1 hypothetical protein SAMN05444320_108128 [Streptoalloteichus hindustanus]
MTLDKQFFTRALGDDEPPLNLDFDKIEAAGRRSARRAKLFPLAAAAVVVAVAVAGVTFTMARGLPSSGQITPAHPGGTQSAPKAPIWTEAPTVRDPAYCYKSADLTSKEINQHVPTSISGRTETGRGDTAAHIVELCRIAWRDNIYEWRPAKPAGEAHDVPDLVACVLSSRSEDVESGAVGVFPGDEQTCADLGLAVARL